MKILYLHQYFATPNSSTGTRSYELSRRWVSWGHEVTVVSSRAADSTLPKSERARTEDGVDLVLLDVKYAHGFGFMRRVISFVAFAVRSTVAVLFGPRFDVVVATSTPLTIALPALAARWVRGMPVVFEVRDVWPDAAVDAGVIRNPAILWVARRLELAAYRSAKAVVALSSGMRDRIVARVPKNVDIHVIPNASDLDAFSASAADRALARAQMGVEGKFVVAYTGTLGRANDIPHLVEIMAITSQNENVCWMIAGAGVDAGLIQKAIEAGSVKNVSLLGSLPKVELRRLLSAADIGVISFLNTPTYFDNSPNKFFDYCAAGLPVLFTRSTWAADQIRAYGAGWVDATHSPSEAARIILATASDLSARDAAARGARQLAEREFERGMLAKRYVQLLESVSSESRSIS